MSEHPSHSEMTPALARLNVMPTSAAIALLLTCCGSQRWAAEMCKARPFLNVQAFLEHADAVWCRLQRDNWLEAFAHHPRIGERNLEQARFASTSALSANEQSGMVAASQSEQTRIYQLNLDYEQKFGHVFLICATGKTPRDILTQLAERLHNDASTELMNAMKQQAQITRLRLERMMAP